MMSTNQTPSAGVDSRTLERVRALLSKAESSAYPEEAAAFTAKANELMARHAISRAMADAETGSGQVVNVRILIEAPYAKEKYRLLAAVAHPNRCRAVLGIDHTDTEVVADPTIAQHLSKSGAIVTMFGYESDIDIVQLLYTSLILQAVNTMLKHGSVTDLRGNNRTRSFRHSFLVGFASIVATRLQEVAHTAAGEAESDSADSGTKSVLPVLADRENQVEHAVSNKFPSLRKLSTTVSNSSGLSAGQNAGATADIGTKNLGGRRPALKRAR